MKKTIILFAVILFAALVYAAVTPRGDVDFREDYRFLRTNATTWVTPNGSVSECIINNTLQMECGWT